MGRGANLVAARLPRSMRYFYGSLKVGAMAMAMYELFSWIEKRTTAWAHRGPQAA